MEAISFKLESYEGPLDVLLFLISKHKLDIQDIEITLLLEQYLAFIDEIAEQDMEYAGEFLEMAARLVYIKTVSLLPQYNEAVELKKELEGRLIEYALCKKAAEILRDNFIGGEIFVRNQMKIDIDNTYTIIHEPTDLLVSLSGISVRDRNNLPVEASVFTPIVSKKIVSVTSKIIYILKKLYSGESFEMDKLYEGMTNRSEKVATFLAVLELTKSGRIVLSEDNLQIYFNRTQRVNS